MLLCRYFYMNDNMVVPLVILNFLILPKSFATYYNQPTAKPITFPTINVFRNDTLICQYSGYCRINSDCVPGNKCVVSNSYYSQCLPDSSTYLTANCLKNLDGQNQCNDNTKCCDPGAYCNQQPFRQCQQPTQFSTMCRTLSSFDANVTSPTVAPFTAILPTTSQPSNQYSTLPANQPTTKPSLLPTKNVFSFETFICQ